MLIRPGGRRGRRSVLGTRSRRTTTVRRGLPVVRHGEDPVEGPQK
ncbi:uncharacterized protein M6B38_186850 [Iris pallida]|uniref:Uncharacterized protein n=1 Tax=Iris pallida TaxID=29817 RepID=A0AAX6EJS1_IRIPA|nr:uncharacterized protein M6B38_186850 [Iris pallida]